MFSLNPFLENEINETLTMFYFLEDKPPANIRYRHCKSKKWDARRNKEYYRWLDKSMEESRKRTKRDSDIMFGMMGNLIETLYKKGREWKVETL